MANSYQIIDEKTWERAMHCMVFRNSVEPAFCVTFEADITNFKRMVKEQGLSFTLAMVYAVCKCANKIEAFRYRFVDGQVVLYDKIDTAFTYLNKETDLFKVVNVPMIDDLKEYCELASKTANEQKEYFTGPLGNDVFQCSPMYCTIPINVRLMQNMFRCFLKLPRKERFRFRQSAWKRKKKRRMLRHRLQPMHCFITENMSRMSR